MSLTDKEKEELKETIHEGLEKQHCLHSNTIKDLGAYKASQEKFSKGVWKVGLLLATALVAWLVNDIRTDAQAASNIRENTKAVQGVVGKFTKHEDSHDEDIQELRAILEDLPNQVSRKVTKNQPEERAETLDGFLKQLPTRERIRVLRLKRQYAPEE